MSLDRLSDAETHRRTGRIVLRGEFGPLQRALAGMRITTADGGAWYGAFFAAVLAAVALPLVRSWRRTAQELVDAQDAPGGEVANFTKTSQERRTLIETRLGINTGLLRSPLTALTVFTPLI